METVGCKWDGGRRIYEEILHATRLEEMEAAKEARIRDELNRILYNNYLLRAEREN